MPGGGASWEEDPGLALALEESRKSHQKSVQQQINDDARLAQAIGLSQEDEAKRFYSASKKAFAPKAEPDVYDDAVKEIQNCALSFYDRTPVLTKGGGDCFYYAIARVLFRNESFMGDVRAALSAFWQDNWQRYTDVSNRSLKEYARTFPLPSTKVDYSIAERIFHDLSVPKEWAEFKFLQIAADCYKCPIEYVVCTNIQPPPNEKFAVTHGKLLPSNDIQRPFNDTIGIALYITLQCPGHFVALTKIGTEAGFIDRTLMVF